MKKQIIKEKIFIKHYDGLRRGFLFSDLPKGLLPNDMIDFKKKKGRFSENYSYDDSSTLIVYLDRIETDSEFEERKNEMNKIRQQLRNERFSLYEKLKKEFDK